VFFGIGQLGSVSDADPKLSPKKEKRKIYNAEEPERLLYFVEV
jgi:hypothetical protein